MMETNDAVVLQHASVLYAEQFSDSAVIAAAEQFFHPSVFCAQLFSVAVVTVVV